MSDELTHQSYRDQLTADQRREAESELFHALLGRLTSRERRVIARWFLQEAAGEPVKRTYIADLVYGKETPDG